MNELQWLGRTLRIRAYGAVSAKALLHVAREVTADTRYDQLQFLVADFLDADWSQTTLLDALEDLTVILIGASMSNRNIRIVVIAQDPYIVELGDAVARLTADGLLPIQIFSNRESAETWVKQQPQHSRPSTRFRLR